MMPVCNNVKKQVHTVVWSDQVSKQIKSPVWTPVLDQVYEIVWARSRNEILNLVQDKVR